MLNLKLTQLPETVKGIYKGKLSNGEQSAEFMPPRMRFLCEEAAKSFLAMDQGEDRLRVSDMLRSADSSLAAVNAGRGAQPPAFSGHNFGFSIDLDLDFMLKQPRFKNSKAALDVFMQSHGWYCFRKDGQLQSEAWHYNYFGDGASTYLNDKEKTNEKSLERCILAHYLKDFQLSTQECQDALSRLGFYSGEIDGDVGPLTRQAVLAFQRAWGLTNSWRSGSESGSLGVVTKRTLAFVEADAVRRGVIKDSTQFAR